MKTAPSTLEPGNPILWVFGYLDSVLSPQLIEEASKYDVSMIRRLESSGISPYDGTRAVVRKMILNTFKLTRWNCPVAEMLNKFKLYHQGDMADALTAAYFLRTRGEDPIKAFEADYILKPYGLLTWEDVDQIKEEGKKNYILSYWSMIERYYEDGDRVIYYNSQVDTGLIVVRGDRLVYECELVHMLIGERSLWWDAAYDHFLSLGGNKGFLSGDFVWPDPDWVNPIDPRTDMAYTQP